MNQRKVGAILSYLTIGLQNLVALIYTPFMLRMLGASEYGLYSLSTSMISYLTLLDLGFGDAVIRYVVRSKAKCDGAEQSSLLGMFSVIYIIIAAVVIFAGCALSVHLELFFHGSMSDMEISRAKIMLLLLTFNLSITIMFSVYKAFIDANEEFVFIRLINILRIILNTLIMTVLLCGGFKAVAQVVLITILNICSIVAQIVYSKKKLSMKISFRDMPWFKTKEIFGYSFFVFLNTMISNVYWSTGQFVLGMYMGAKVIAVYAIAIQLTNMYKHFTSSISTVFFPKMTALVMSNDSDEDVSELFIKIGRIQYMIIALILSGFILFGRCFIRLWAGDEYSEAYVVALIFFIALIPPQIQHMGWIVTKARNQLKFRTYTYVFIAFLCFLLLFPLAKYWGMKGVALVIAGGLLLMEGLVLNVYYQLRQKINIIRFWNEIMKLSVLPIALTTACFFLFDFSLLQSWTELGITMIIYSVIYLFLLICFFANQYEKKLIVSLLGKVFPCFK